MYRRKSNFHSREKCLIGLVLITLCLLCFGGIFLLPDNFGSDRVLRVYKQFQKAGPEIFIPAPPLAGHVPHKDQDPHFLNDREKLQAEIKEELGEIMDKPELQDNMEQESDGDTAPDGGIDDTGNAAAGAAPPLNSPNKNTEDGGAPFDEIAAMDNNNLPVGNVNLQMPLGGHAESNPTVEVRRVN